MFYFIKLKLIYISIEILNNTHTDLNGSNQLGHLNRSSESLSRRSLLLEEVLDDDNEEIENSFNDIVNIKT